MILKKFEEDRPVDSNQNLSNTTELFELQKNCWRVAEAEHATLLIDCANFYSAIHDAISKAKHSIFILGWEIDSQTRLLRGDKEKESKIPSVIIELLDWKAKQNPEIQIYLCRWDASVVFVTDRDLMPEFVWANNTPENVHVCLDGNVPMGGSHHQKIILIDDELVFTGGMDIARQRWDTREHNIVEPERNDVLGAYAPYHDVQIMMDGPVTKDLAELVRERWSKAVNYEPPAIREVNRANLKSTVPSWPERFPVNLKKINCAISRTIPRLDNQEKVQEIYQMYFDLINKAEEFIYIENQFLSSVEIAIALNKRLIEKPKLKILLVSSYEPQGLFERESFWAGRIDFKKIIEKNVERERVRVTYPQIKDANGSKACKRIHSKIFIVDNKFMTVASSNLNNRSMILDTECDVTFAAVTEEQATQLTYFRNDLLSEHTGRTIEQTSKIFETNFTLDDLMNSSARNGYALHEVNDSQFTDQSLKVVIDRVADPQVPLMSYVALDSTGVPVRLEPFTNPRKHVLAFFVLLGFAIIGAIFYLKSHSEWFQPVRIKEFLEFAQNSRFALPLVCLIYVVGGFVLFPVTVLSLFTAAVFGAILGPLYGMIGSLLSAALMFWIGNVAGLKGLRKLFGEKIRAIDRKFHDSGILGVAALRFIPIAPYSIVNLAAGISSVTFFDFMVGTFLGFLPGLFIKGLVGDSLVQVFISPNPKARMYLALGVVLWVALVAASYFLTKQWRKRHPA